MEISSYIASMSMAMSNTQLRQSVNVSTLKMAMNTQDMQAEAIATMLDVPSFGHQMDIRV